MKKTKLLAVLLTFAMLLSTAVLFVPVSAATPSDCLTLDQIGDTYKLQNGFNVSDYGTATVVGVKDAVYAEHSHARGN